MYEIFLLDLAKINLAVLLLLPRVRKVVTPLISTTGGLRPWPVRRYSEAVKADVRKRMSPPHRESVAQISAALGIHIVTLYNWRKAWRLQ